LIGIESIIVPTRYCEDGAILPQPNQKTHIVPLGLDRETFQPFERKRADKLRLMFFDTHADAYDAGGDIAITAFIRAFPEKRDDVSLDIWSTQRERLEAPDMRIQLRRHIGSDGDLVRLYRRYDALLATQRGTGFGLIATEAMATGMPVFHSGQGGFASIADLGVLTGAHKRSTVKAAHDSAECFEPLADVVATRLRQIDTDYEAFQAKALQDAEIVRERFTWEKTARAILEALR
jgi:glycosyltransferase involved in cell wall biosynthesis